MNATLAELEGQVGGFVRLAPDDKNNGWLAARLMRLDGERAHVIPAGHRREEVISVDRIHKWKAVWKGGGAAKEKEIDAGTAWVVADSKLPRYVTDDADGYTGNPAEASAFPDMASAMSHAQKFARAALFAMPLNAAIERYAAQNPETEIVEVPVEVQVPVEVDRPQTPVSLSGMLSAILDRRNAAQERVAFAQRELETRRAEAVAVDSELRDIRAALGGTVASAVPYTRPDRSTSSEGVMNVLKAKTTSGVVYSIAQLSRILCDQGMRDQADARGLGQRLCGPSGRGLFSRYGPGVYRRL